MKQKIFTLAAVLIAVILLLNFCYSIYDARGLAFYDGEKIAQIYPFYDRVYIVTENGDGYVAGSNSQSSSQRYRSAGAHYSEALGMTCPVRFFKGEIAKMMPYSQGGAFFITAEGELYGMYDFEVEKIADSAIHAAAAGLETIYFVDSDNKLWLCEEGKKTFLLENVRSAEVYRGRVFVLGTNGELCELMGTGELSAPLFTGACAFSVHDTSLRFIDEHYVYDDAEGLATPLFNVLAEDGTLYAKGCYNLLSCGYGGITSPKPMPHYVREWTVIGEGVSSYSSSVMGTVMVFKNGKCAYYGFDTEMDLSSGFGYMELEAENVVSAYAGNLLVYVETAEDKRYAWGTDFNPLISEREVHNIFTGSARELGF
ncbi:MAG: hypothetical protein IJW21_06240 [Clostridia bacterium]|nr:hypothetical protein [Clostridia bacterium]